MSTIGRIRESVRHKRAQDYNGDSVVIVEVDSAEALCDLYDEARMFVDRNFASVPQGYWPDWLKRMAVALSRLDGDAEGE